jgi:hypothetical protein
MIIRALRNLVCIYQSPLGKTTILCSMHSRHYFIYEYVLIYMYAIVYSIGHHATAVVYLTWCCSFGLKGIQNPLLPPVTG